MGMAVSIVLAVLVFGYAGWILYRVLSGIFSGKGNPYGCSGDCSKCGGCVSAHPGRAKKSPLK